MEIPNIPKDINLHYRRPKEDGRCFFCAKDKATMKCGRCTRAKYCNRECQTSHWKVHKRDCVSFKEEGAPQPISNNTIFEPSKPIEQQKEQLLKIIENLKSGKKEADDFVCSTCGARSKCINSVEKPMDDVSDGVTANATFLCASNHLSVATDVRFSLQQECNCDIVIPTITHPQNPEQRRQCETLVSTTPRLLIVTGFHLFHKENALYYTKFTPE